MDDDRFDDLLRAITDTRRSLLGTSGLVVLGWAGRPTVEAKKRRHKRKRRRPPPTPPPVSPPPVSPPPTCSPACSSCQTCQNGQCVALADGAACPDDGDACTSD